jgi:hypothetical protein
LIICVGITVLASNEKSARAVSETVGMIISEDTQSTESTEFNHESGKRNVEILSERGNTDQTPDKEMNSVSNQTLNNTS